MRNWMGKMTMAVVLMLAFLGASAQSADDVLGKWKTGSGDAHVEIFKRGGKYFGKIVWLKEPLREDGTEKLDRENPDEALRSRKILGLEMLEGFEFDDDEWEDGTIYDPKSGKTYSCVMELEDGILKVRGYIGISLIGRTDEWTRP